MDTIKFPTHYRYRISKKWSTPEDAWTAKDVKKWRIDNNYTRHERNNGVTMDLVPFDINRVFKHLGGVSEVK